MEEYTNRELFILLTDIKEQVIKTNSRVSNLEKWKYGMSGAITVLTGFLAILSVKLQIIF